MSKPATAAVAPPLPSIEIVPIDNGFILRSTCGDGRCIRTAHHVLEDAIIGARSALTPIPTPSPPRSPPPRPDPAAHRGAAGSGRRSPPAWRL